MRPYYIRRHIYFLEYAKRYREQNKELIKYKRLKKRREIENENVVCEYIIRDSFNGSIIKKYMGVLYNAICKK
jgi:hypothetical protein